MLRENYFYFPKVMWMSSEFSWLSLPEIWFVFTSCVTEKDMRTSLISSVNIIFLCSYFLLGLGIFLRKLSTRLGSTIPMSKWFPILWILMKMYVWNNTFQHDCLCYLVAIYIYIVQDEHFNATDVAICPAKENENCMLSSLPGKKQAEDNSSNPVSVVWLRYHSFPSMTTSHLAQDSAAHPPRRDNRHLSRLNNAITVIILFNSNLSHSSLEITQFNASSTVTSVFYSRFYLAHMILEIASLFFFYREY